MVDPNNSIFLQTMLVKDSEKWTLFRYIPFDVRTTKFELENSILNFPSIHIGHFSKYRRLQDLEKLRLGQSLCGPRDICILQ